MQKNILTMANMNTTLLRRQEVRVAAKRGILAYAKAKVRERVRQTLADSMQTSALRIATVEKLRPELAIQRLAIRNAMEKNKLKILERLQTQEMERTLEQGRKENKYWMPAVIVVEQWSAVMLDELATSDDQRALPIVDHMQLRKLSKRYGAKHENICPALMTAMSRASPESTFVLFRLYERAGYGRDMLQVEGLKEQDIGIFNTSFHELCKSDICANCHVKARRGIMPFLSCRPPCGLWYCSFLCRVSYMTEKLHREACPGVAAGHGDFGGSVPKVSFPAKRPKLS
jgi:hypothetical protein